MPASACTIADMEEGACFNPAADLHDLPDAPAVYALHFKHREPWIGRTGLLRRRIARLLRGDSVRAAVTSVEYWLTASRLESLLVLYEASRAALPDRYMQHLKLRLPAWVRLTAGTEWPRTQVTAKLGAGTYFGPFRTRAAAEAFEHAALDLFQLRRCQEELVPSPEHPGCIYGEMNLCLRPCQAAVTASEYASESARVQEFLSLRGATLLENARHARERCSAELEFEEAARQHSRVEQITAAFDLAGEAAAELRHFSGVAVLPSVAADTVRLQFLREGCWMPPISFATGLSAPSGQSMDHRLRDIVAGLPEASRDPRLVQEHCALWTRWYFSSWRDGAWLSFDVHGEPPWRRLVAAVSRTAAAARVNSA